ncbi:MAG: hypothetical protein MPJ05_07635 [Nitrosopumilus sp.]|nr:hypothetical protein [Nitrosopumilus sp.]
MAGGLVWAACVVAACAALAPGMADAQQYAGVLWLDPVPSTATAGDQVRFSGSLTTTSGHSVRDATIHIKDNVSFGRDSTMMTLRTDSSGYFSGTWTARERSSGAWDFYAVFEGSGDVRKARSSEYSVTVYPGRSGSPDAGPRQYEGVLRLDRIPSTATVGDLVRFSGSLTTTSGHFVSGSTVRIKDNVSFGSDDTIMSLVTGPSGQFSGTWTARERSSGAWDFYAEFRGSQQVTSARSSEYSITVSGTAASKITLDAPPSSVRAGDIVTFTGRAEAGRAPLAGAWIEIREDDPFLPDQLLASGHTGSNGRFAITWDVTAGLVEKDFDVYAELLEGAGHAKSQTPRYTVEVTKYGGSLALDPLPASARIGEPVEFSGALSLEGHRPEGAVIYVKDEDPLNPDDLLATAYVGSDGRFSATWFASDVDEDSVADIYAVFEGDGRLGRLTTCDTGVTFDFGGSCMDTVPLRILPSIAPGPPDLPPRPDPPGGTGYMKLLFSIDTPGPPHVVIVPSPDSYDKVRGHIIPAEEGIRMWSGMLAERYGGDWDVRIDVLHRNAGFMAEKPDIIMNIVDHDGHQECLSEYSGIAYGVLMPAPTLPIQTVVCSTSGGVRNSNTEVSAISAHEFIHAMGLGHTFDKAGDLMCSVEAAGPTCPYSFTHSSVPSLLNLGSIARIYGSDGYQVPNNDFEFLAKYWLGDPVDGSKKPVKQGNSAEPAEAEFQFGPGPATGPAVATPPARAFEKGIRITDDTIRIQIGQKEIDGAQMGPRVLTGSMLTSHGSEMHVDLAVYTQSGTCVIGPGCMVSGSTRGPGKIHEVIMVDGMNLKVRYSGPDARIERFDILDASGGFLPYSIWRVDVLKDDQPSRLYYKVKYVPVT